MMGAETQVPKYVPKSELEVLNQDISDERGLYRIRARNRVHYLTIPTTVIDWETMGIPFLLIPQLPEFPDTDWTRMVISREHGKLIHVISSEPLPSLSFTFHENLVDCLSLDYVKYLRSGVHVVSYNDKPAVAEYSCFDWDFYRIQHENWAYQILHNDHDPSQSRIAPNELGHLTENGRPIGLLLEKLDGRYAYIQDKTSCEKTLAVLHAEPLRLTHGDVNRFNMIVDKMDGSVKLVDFEHAKQYEEAAAKSELESLDAQLTEETGRGGRFVGDFIDWDTA